MSCIVGVDVGGTKISAAVVEDDGTYDAPRIVATPMNDGEAIESAVVALVETVRAGRSLTAVGIGAAGWIDAERDLVRYAPHLAWRDLALGRRLAERLGVPVWLENDANAAAWAEYRFGAARGHRVALCVTVGTGLGGGIVVDGTLFRGAFGMAGEWGHLRVVPDGRRCACGNRGCWEQYASGSALARDARELIETSPGTIGRLAELVGSGAQLLTGADVSAAAAAGDLAAVDLVTEAGRWLGQGIADIAAILDPSVIVIAGGVAEVGELFLAPARARFGQVFAGRGHRSHPDIVAATMGANAGIVGAADLARYRGVGTSE
ncbi:ROK family glucokinase [Cumulibacter soli]|uniref:ROK family glucokinase n=1 Tax=Cumulibacter soli TaxID=2546344 RepID=UPI0010680B60|nr:ROK family glucokinase [Cumulibacter soli]